MKKTYVLLALLAKIKNEDEMRDFIKRQNGGE